MNWRWYILVDKQIWNIFNERQVDVYNHMVAMFSFETENYKLIIYFFQVKIYTLYLEINAITLIFSIFLTNLIYKMY